MIANLKQWEGKLVNGEFSLQRALGGSDHSAVFLVEKSGGSQSQTAIRFIDANSRDASDQLQRWEAASRLNHPNLLRIFKTGRCEIDGDDFLYALTEFADEDLSQILPQRALNAGETRQVLEAGLTALSYLHSEGLVHGSLKPSSVFAVDNTIKISSDTLGFTGQPLPSHAERSTYDAPETEGGTLAPAADIWSLGVTLCEALTQRLPLLDGQVGPPALPQGIPRPFEEIIENCLQLDPGRRWTVEQIADRLRREKNEASRPGAVAVPSPAARGPVDVSYAPREREPAAPFSTAEQKRSAKWPYAIALAVVVVTIVLIARPKPPRAQSPAQTTQHNASAPSSTHQHALAAEGRAGEAASASGVARGGRGRVVERLMPQPSPSAMRTIRGGVRIALNVKVDEAGNVTRADLKSGRSRYFVRQALEAAKRWKFQPPLVNGQPVVSQWLVQFVFRRGAIDASARQIEP